MEKMKDFAKFCEEHPNISTLEEMKAKCLEEGFNGKFDEDNRRCYV